MIKVTWSVTLRPGRSSKPKKNYIKDILSTDNCLVWVSLFNGISTFMGYLKPKLSL